MADRYIIMGATYNGDGTTSAEATADGGVGAWNHGAATTSGGGAWTAIQYFEGTAPAYGTLPAGTTVYVRSKDAAGADITIAKSAATTLGGTAATAGSPIRWIIDNGVTWPGINGVITYNVSGNVTITVRAHNPVQVLTQYALKIIGVSTSTSKVYFVNSTTISGVYFRGPPAGYITEGIVTMGAYSAAIDCFFTGGLLTIRPVGSSNRCFSTLINPSIELTQASTGVFTTEYSNVGAMKILGGKIFGVGATTGSSLVGDSDQGRMLFEFVGFKVPRTMDIVRPTAALAGYLEVRLIAADGNFGGHYETDWGYATSRTDNYPPYLDATVPDSVSTKWAWRVYAKRASSGTPMVLPTLKFYSGDAAVRVITQEVLIADTITATKSDMWICVGYIDDATGETKHISTLDYSTTAALDTSPAAWLPSSTWGMVNFNKYKLSVATPTSIKTDSPITVTLMSTITPASANDLYFVNPDFSVV